VISRALDHQSRPKTPGRSKATRTLEYIRRRQGPGDRIAANAAAPSQGSKCRPGDHPDISVTRDISANSRCAAPARDEKPRDQLVKIRSE